MVVQGVAAGIGFASESIHHYKEKRRAEKERPNDPSRPRGEESTHFAAGDWEDLVERELELSRQADEAAWDLDDEQREQAATNELPSDARPERRDNDPEPEEVFVSTHPAPPPHASAPVRLALPIIITQRRPKSRARGFIRTYAPLLQEVGIDQATFLDFIDQLNSAVQPSPWIQAINLAALAGNAVPEPFTIMISIAVKMAADAASEVHSRSKTNAFLDRVNESFFAPRGLVCLIMTWKPRSTEALTMADFELSSSIAQASCNTQTAGGPARLARRMQPSSGSSSFEWPEAAPLTFPALDALAGSESEGASAAKQSAIKRGGKFVEQYLDKRAQAKWAGQNPDSKMANSAPKPEFHSRYADPNHPASSGDPLAFLTGGYIHTGMVSSRLSGGMEGRGLGRGGMLRADILGRRGVTFDRPRRQAKRDASHMKNFQIGEAEAYGQDLSRLQPRPGLGGAELGIGPGIGPLSLITGARKLLQTDVLYLMIVNRPTEEEMERAAAVMTSQ
ncbi:FAD binding domain protein [Pleurostoma richardsiae]|uniref:FAD binding domain protein n=1 Tax=Pleurostoma richardsiae TaxID=41990 RepID=A0AA38RBM8_9PEZI|nr:FAD binding domain protein [Pleurostoma richardsiae]